MKTKKSLLISTLMFLTVGFSGIPKEALALVEKDGAKYWTFEEMLELDLEVNREKLEVCGTDNYDCELEFEMNLMERGEQYLVYDMFDFQQMFMTAVNPAKNTIKFFYRDEDRMMRMFGIDEKFPLEEYIVFWTDNEIENLYPGELLKGFKYYTEPMLNGESVDGLHPIFFGNVTLNGENWFEPNKELEFTTISDDTKENANGFFYRIGKSNGTFIGRIYYSDCVNSEEYKEGMECRLMFGGTPETLKMTYFPFLEEEDEEDEDNNEEVAAEIIEKEETGIVEEVEAVEVTEIPKDMETVEATEMSKDMETVEVTEMIEMIETSKEAELEQLVAEVEEEAVAAEEVAAAEEAAAEEEVIQEKPVLETQLQEEPATEIEVPLAAKAEKSGDFPWGIATLCTVGTIYTACWFLPIEKITKNLNFFQKKC